MNEPTNTPNQNSEEPSTDETKVITTEETEVATMDEVENERTPLTKKQIAAIVILAVIAVVSFFGPSALASEEGNFAGTYQTLTDKQNAVLGMTAASAGASTAITVLPGDVGTPVADKMADLSGYFIFILCAIFIEKWLLTTFGFIAFKIMIPIALILIIIGIVAASKGIQKMAAKLIIFALILFFIVPVSVMITDHMDESYQKSVDQTITEINEDSEELNAASEDEGLLDKIINTVKGGAMGIANKFKEKLTNFTEYVAYLIVTACVIPIGVILLIIWIIKMMTGVAIRLPKPKGSKVLHKIKGS